MEGRMNLCGLCEREITNGEVAFHDADKKKDYHGSCHGLIVSLKDDIIRAKIRQILIGYDTAGGG